MTDLPDSPGDSTGDSKGQARVRPGRGSTTGRPRWVNVFGIIALVLVLVFLIQHLVGGGVGHLMHQTP